mgnify:CR=1 FL=1
MQDYTFDEGFNNLYYINITDSYLYRYNLSNDLKKQFPDITRVQMSKSSSGFSIRAYIEISIHYNGNNVKTEANLRDRSGLSCEMLVGLKDML